MDNIQEEVAAARRPRQAFFALFVLSLLVPVLAAVWLLYRAERSAVGHDIVLRTLIRHGAAEPVLRHYLNRQEGPQCRLPSGSANGADLELPRSRRSGRRRRRRRRRPTPPVWPSH